MLIGVAVLSLSTMVTNAVQASVFVLDDVSSRYVAGGLSLILAESLLIFEMVRLRKKRRKIEDALVKSEETLRRTEAVVRESERRFRLVANTAPVMIWMSGVDKLCTYFNRPWLEFSGRTLEEESGNGWVEGAHPDDLSQCHDTYTRAFDQRESFQIQYRRRRNDGEYRWIINSGVPRFDADGSFAGYIGSAIDITERKLAEEALSMVSRKLIEAHEQERAWLARELHDDISQRLCVLLMSLESLKRAGTPAKSGRGIEDAMQKVSNLALDMQRLSHRLHSSKLELVGLTTAAAGYCGEVADHHKVEIDLWAENMPGNLSPEISISIFRVLQEALQNAIKHSGSQHFTVLLNRNSNEIHLTVHDSGRGFDAAQAMRGRGLGLTSMKERVALIDGELSIESQPQNGTTVYVRVPLQYKMKAAHAGSIN